MNSADVGLQDLYEMGYKFTKTKRLVELNGPASSDLHEMEKSFREQFFKKRIR